MQISTIQKSFFTSTEVQALGDAIVKTLEAENQQDQSLLGVILQNLKQALGLLNQSRTHSNHNSQTDRLEEADLARDYAFRAFWGMIEAGTLRQNEAYRTAALSVMNQFKPFDKRLHTFGYDKQSIALRDFMTAMEKEEVQQALETMNIRDWLEELKTMQNQFEEVYEGKINEETQKQVLIPTREAREQVFNYLNALIQTLNALELGKAETQSAINTKINQIVEDFEGKARSRKTRKKNEGKQPKDEPIDGK